MMKDEHDQWDQRTPTEDEQICSTIEQVLGVECLKVWQRLGVYHCAVRTERKDLKRVVNEIRTLVGNARNVDIREENIHFTLTSAQIELPTGRIELLSVKTQSTQSSFSVDVTLQYHGNEVTGHAEGGLDIEERMKTAGEATQEALTQLIPEGGNLAIKDIERVSIKNKEIVLSLATLSYRGEKIHCGAAVNRADDCETVVRATLDSVNRYIDVFLGK